MFGREYNVRGHGNKQYVQQLADFINQRADWISERAAVVSTLDLVILTLLNITDEMFRDKLLREQTIKELEDKAEKLLKATDRKL